MIKHLIETHPEIAAQWHPTKNGSLKPEEVTYGSAKRVWWTCPVALDHEWVASVGNKINASGIGCPFCLGRKVAKSNCLATTHPEIAAQWHPTKNGSLKPEEVTYGFTKKVWWRCNKFLDHEWDVSPHCRLSGGRSRQCPYCEGLRVCKSNCLATTHPEIAAQWHPTKNGSLKPEEVTAGSVKKIWWVCPVSPDHEWKSTPNGRTSHAGQCPYCEGLRVCKSNCLATTHPEIAAQWHPTKNDLLTSSDVVAGSKKNVWWQCERGHVWKTNINSRANKCNATGCPKCKVSKGENRIARYLESKKLQYSYQYKFPSCRYKKPLIFDFVIYRDNKKFCVEYQGMQHYQRDGNLFGSKNWQKEFDGVIIRDEIKRNWCISNKIPLLEVPFWELEKVEFLLDDFLSRN